MDVVLEDWITEAKSELDIDLDVDIAELLEMTKTVAHGVARPAAPLTAFLVGYAAATVGGGPDAVAAASRRVAALAERWATEPHADSSSVDPGHKDEGGHDDRGSSAGSSSPAGGSRRDGHRAG